MYGPRRKNKIICAPGEILRNSLNGGFMTKFETGPDLSLLKTLIDNQYKHNPWFTPENVKEL